MAFKGVGEMCCGCGVCSKVCPVDAIKMEKDKHGFVYPEFLAKSAYPATNVIRVSYSE